MLSTAPRGRLAAVLAVAGWTALIGYGLGGPAGLGLLAFSVLLPIVWRQDAVKAAVARAPTPSRVADRPPPAFPTATRVPRGVRPYVPGDLWRDVHWAATARTGRTWVKEHDLFPEDPPSPPAPPHPLPERADRPPSPLWDSLLNLIWFALLAWPFLAVHAAGLALWAVLIAAMVLGAWAFTQARTWDRMAWLWVLGSLLLVLAHARVTDVPAAAFVALGALRLLHVLAPASHRPFARNLAVALLLLIPLVPAVAGAPTLAWHPPGTGTLARIGGALLAWHPAADGLSTAPIAGKALPPPPVPGDAGLRVPATITVGHLPAKADVPVLRISGAPRAAYWKLASYNAFDGRRWSDPTDVLAAANPGGSLPPPAVTGFPTSKWRVSVRLLNGLSPDAALPYVGDPRSVALGSDPATYVLTAAVPRLDAAALVSAQPRAVPAALHLDLQLPPGLPLAVAKLARTITRGQTGPWRQALAIAAYLRSHEAYVLRREPPAPDAVGTFLFRTHRGYCDQFSTALAIMLRTLGVPTRWVVGYGPGHYDPGSHTANIRSTDAHSWTEVYLAGHGWVPLDPTPAAVSPAADLAAASVHVPASVAHRAAWLLAALLVSLVVAAMLASQRRSPLQRLWRDLRKARRHWPQIEPPRTPREALRGLPAEAVRALTPAVGLLERAWYGGERPAPSDVLAAHRALRQAR